LHIHEPVAITCLVGVAGAAVPEVLRTIAALRADRLPTRRELLASSLAALLGLVLQRHLV
jgi:hypothetical protein